MSHTPTLFIVAVLPALVEAGAWKSTAEIMALVPDLSRNTGTRILAELARNLWVIKAEREGVTHWLPGPMLLDEAEAWREAVSARITADMAMLRRQRRIAKGLQEYSLEPAHPHVQREIMPIVERGEPEHQGAALTIAVLKLLARHPQWVSVHQLQLCTSAHRATILDLVGDLVTAGWLAEHAGTFQLTPTWPSVGLATVVKPAERAESARVALLELQREEERRRADMREQR